MGPRWIEIHVHRERARAPNPKGGEKGPVWRDIFSGERIRKKQAQKPVKGGAQGHRQKVGKREAVGRNVRATSVREKHKTVGRNQEGCPEERRTDRKLIADVSGFRLLARKQLAVRHGAGLREIEIGVTPVFFETQIVLNERSADIRVVTDAVAMDDGSDQRKGAQEKDQENSWVATITIHRGSRGR